MIKTVVKPTDQNLFIKLPESYVGKDIQLIAYPVNEEKTSLMISESNETYFASEKVLAKDWLNSDEDKAWQDL